MLLIRSATKPDWDSIWPIFQGVLRAGDTYALPSDLSPAEAKTFWLRPDQYVYVAVQEGRIVGTYWLRPNQSGPGGHVANAAFLVAPFARGQGVGRALGEHGLAEAQRLGFRAMQFNFVVSTNTAAIHLWQQLGFTVVGTLPHAFRHPQRGFVDACVMFRSLTDAHGNLD